MDMESDRRFLLRAGRIAVWLVVLYVSARYVWKLFLPFLLGLLIVLLLRPAARFVHKHSGFGERGASVVSVVVFFTVLTAALWMCAALLFQQAADWSERLPALYGEIIEPALSETNYTVIEWISRFLPRVGMGTGEAFAAVNESLKNLLVNLSEWCVGCTADFLKGVPTAVLTLLFTLLSAVLTAWDYGAVSRFILRWVPQRHHAALLELKRFLGTALVRIVKANLILLVITFAELALGLWILQVRGFLLIAAVIALLDLLPVVGSGLILLPWAGYLLLSRQYFTGTGLLIVWGIVSVVRESLEPKVLGDQIGLHPLLTLTAMYCGLRLGGAAGLLLAPLACLIVKQLQESGVFRTGRDGPS